MGLTTKATFIGVLALILWSFYSLFIVKTVGNIPPFQLITITLGITFFIKVILAFLKGETKQIFKQPLFVWGLGIFFILYMILSYLAFNYAPALEVSLLNYLWPLFMALGTIWLSGKPIKIHYIIALFIGVLGVFICITKGKYEFSNTLQIGHVFAFIAALSWAIYSVFTKKIKHINSNMVTLFIGITALISFILHNALEETQYNYEGMFIPIFGLVLINFGLFLWDYATKHGNVILLSIYAFATPILAVFWLILFTDEQASLSFWIAVLLIVGSTCLASSDTFIKLLKKSNSK